jgi:hypothetical protein
MPFYSHRRWYRPIVMGISYVNRYSFNCHMLCPKIHHGWYRHTILGISLRQSIVEEYESVSFS